MKVGDNVKHKSRSDVGIGVVVDIGPDGLCTVKFANSVFSGLPIDTFISAEEELKQQKIKHAREQDLFKKAHEQEWRKNLRERVLTHLKIYDFQGANKIYSEECYQWWSRTEFLSEVQQAKLKQVEQRAADEAAKISQQRELMRARVISLLNHLDFDESDRLYETECSSWWNQIDYDQAKSEILFANRFVETYQTKSLSELDELYRTKERHHALTIDEFIALKTPLVRKKLETLGLKLDKEQEFSCAHPSARVLIKARAGSGKTRTLCARAALSIDDENLDPNQIMILAFNKAAANEVKHRIQKMASIDDYENARTFHSLAHQLVKPQKRLLFDNGGQVSAREQSRFVQKLMHRIMNPAFKESMIEFFRKELEQVEDIGRGLPPEEYYVFRRAMEHVSLKGDRVKSNGEKIIADFLFEHGIEYRYERAWMWKSDFLGGSTYKPDFSIIANGNDFILEHWAIDPDDPLAYLPDEWDLTATQYKKQILAKRDFWKSKNIALIETTTVMMNGDRKSFERKLQNILELSGITCNLLSKEEITRRVFDNDFTISRVSDLFLQFIVRSKKRGWSADKIADIISKNPDREPRSRLFHQLALRAYREYELMLEEENAMDFDDLLMQACEEVESRGKDASIHLGQGRMIAIRNLKWILLDEYQDFSELYFRLLRAILNCNPSVRMVAVGDDWQAINAFAGAELRFFYSFSDYFPGGETVGVTTNYRSDRAVVAAGNFLMAGRGAEAKISRSAQGFIRTRYLGDTWIEFRQGLQYEKEKRADSIYLPQRSDGKNPSESALRLAQALKTCAQIILQDPAKKTMLLARTGLIYGLDRHDFLERLIKSLSTFEGIDTKNLEQNLSIMTAHGSKGQESSRVIILDVTRRQFPKIHPDNLLFEMFGVTPHSVLEEERRLFYVAMTRAEHELYLVTDIDEESHYLEEIKASTPASVSFQDSRINGGLPMGNLAQKIKQMLLESGTVF